MKDKIIIVLLIFFITPFLYSQKRNLEDLKMEIVFQDFFKNDTITLKVNKKIIIKEAIISSDRVLGVTDLQYDFTNNSIINRFDKENKFPRVNFQIKLKRIVNIDILFNKVKESFKIDLTKGKYIGFNNKNGRLFVNQLKRPFSYD